jgi:hypothetical protein
MYVEDRWKDVSGYNGFSSKSVDGSTNYKRKGKPMNLSKSHVHIIKMGVKLPAATAHVYLQLSIAYLEHC